jgi:4-amino-4-deoxy-L-arabinose transferase-like glycosyltransferase
VAAALACLLLGVVDRWPSRAVSPVVACGLLTGLAFMAKGTPSVLVLVVPLAFVLLFARRELRASPARLLAGALLVAGLAGLGYALWKKLQAQGIWAAGPTPMPAWAVAALALAALISLYVGLRSYWVRAPWGLALLAALLLAAWWYVFLWVKLGTAEFGKMVEYELAGRLAGQMHRQAVYYYLLAFPALFFPWSPALLSALGCAWTKVTAGLPLHSIRKEGPTPEELRAVSDPFLAAWVVGTVAFFSIPGAKLGSYILPAFPAAALLTARFLLKLRRSAEPVGTGWRLLPPIFAGLVALGLVLLPAQVHRLPREAQEAISQLPVPLWLISGMLILFMCAPWFRACLSRRPSAAALPLAFSMAVLWALAVPTALARFEFKATNRDLSRHPEVARRAAEAASIYTVGWEEEGLVYYLRRTVREVRKPDAAMKETMGAVIREALASQPPGRILMFAHKRKLEKWLGRPLPPDARPIAENSYVVVLVNEPER